MPEFAYASATTLAALEFLNQDPAFWWTVAALSSVLALGAFVQAVVGFGIALVATPWVLIFAPELMPISVLMCGLVTPVTQLVAGPRRIDWSLIRVALAARILLTPVGVWIVATASTGAIAILVSALILVSIGVALRTPNVNLTPRSSFIAGAITGVTGTAASIGGPFVALTLRGRDPDLVRSTLAVFFTCGAAVSLAALAVGGANQPTAWVAGLCWTPAVLAGFGAAQPLKHRIDAELLRKLTLGLCLLSCPVVILRAFLIPA